MVRFRMIHLLSAAVIVVVFAASVALVYAANFGIGAAVLFSMFNVVGATFPPSASLVDAKNPFILTAVTIGAIGNIAFTIIFTTLFYQLLGSIDLRYLVSRQRIRVESKHMVITPINGIGLNLAKQVRAQGIGVVFVDNDGLRVRKAIKDGFLALHADPTQQESLLGARIGEAAVLLALDDNDIENTFVTLAARSANSRIRIISRVKRLEDISKMERAGARRVISPEVAIGEEMADFIASGVGASAPLG